MRFKKNKIFNIKKGILILKKYIFFIALFALLLLLK